jgi:hypothetical protein
MRYKPSRLPLIDSVEIVNLKGIRPSRVSLYMKEAGSANSIRLIDESAQEIAELWRRLSWGWQMRCHIPPFGLRFYNNGTLLLQASVCWQCNNIYGDENGSDFHCAFNAKRSSSQKLLSICQQSFR